MKLRRITIENYKALSHVDIAVREDLLFLIGGNGAGKSSILQALSIAHHFGQGMTGEFFKERGWKPRDAQPKVATVTPLRASTSAEGSRRLPRRDLGMALAFEHERRRLLWTFRWSYTTERSVEECVWVLDRGSSRPRRILSMPGAPDDDQLFSELMRRTQLDLSGSLLSIVKSASTITSDERDAELLEQLKSWLAGITSLELLSPASMRGRLRSGGGGIGAQGEHLASFLANLPPDAKSAIVRRMADFYPIRDLDTTRKRAGWVDMRIAEAFKLIGRVDIAHMSDGFLRILALCAIPELKDAARLVLIDEVEDGIEPHILPALIERIALDSLAQLVVTSHSPLLINYFEPHQIYFLARNRSGHTIGAEAGELEPFRTGSDYLGSGEIWANASLNSLEASLPRRQPPRNSIIGAPTADLVRRHLYG